MSPEPFACHGSEFRCPGEDKCIPLSAVCDKSNDCASGADEVHCHTEKAEEEHDIEDLSGDRELESECRESFCQFIAYKSYSAWESF